MPGFLPLSLKGMRTMIFQRFDFCFRSRGWDLGPGDSWVVVSIRVPF